MQMLNNATAMNTHQKRYNFPTTNTLRRSKYPDVTQAVEKLRDQAVKELKYKWKWNEKNIAYVIKDYLRNFAPGHAWDTKSLPNFPAGKQFAIYKGHIVPASYIANNLYGQVSAGLYMPLNEALKGGDIGALGGSLKYVLGYDLKTIGYDIKTHFSQSKKHPFQWNVTFHDQAEDQWAIKSGYYDYKYNNPWFNKGYVYRKIK